MASFGVISQATPELIEEYKECSSVIPSSMTQYSNIYVDYFDEENLDGKKFYTIKRKWNERLFHSKPIPTGKRKILAIGDSFTWGQGVRFEDTYIKKIEKLNENVVGINIAESGADLNKIKNRY